MSTGLIIALSIVVAFIALILFNYFKMKNVSDTKSSEKIRILNLKNFKNQTRSGLVLVDYWAPWCGPCKVMSPILNDLAEEVDESVTVAKVNVDHNQALAKKFKVRSIPTLILYQDGVEVDRFMGVKSKKFLLKELQKAR